MLKADDPIKVDKVKVGGTFMTIKDMDGNIYCWGHEYHKDVKISKESLLTKKIPKKVLSSVDKVTDIAMGGSFSIAFAKWREVTVGAEEEEAMEALKT